MLTSTNGTDLLAAFVIALVGALPLQRDASDATPVSAPKSAYEIAFTAIEGGPLPLSSFEGKVVLVVNTASFCGFTRQYRGLQQLWADYRDRGLIVLGVPSNDFGNQEPGTAEQIKDFCEGAYGVTFPLTDKVAVRGPSAHPFYVWARAELGAAKAPRWNFHKYLVGRDGQLLTAFGSNVEPGSKRLRAAVEAALKSGTGS